MNPFLSIKNPWAAIRIAQAYTLATSASCVLSMLAMVNLVEREDHDFTADISVLLAATWRNGKPMDMSEISAHAENFLYEIDADYWADAGLRPY